MSDSDSDAAELKVTQPTFHAREGWFFLRGDDGSVRIQRRSEAGLLGDDVLADVTLEASSWASVVAFVSASGENARSFAAALAFHEGRADDATERAAELAGQLEQAQATIARLEADVDAAEESGILHAHRLAEE